MYQKRRGKNDPPSLSSSSILPFPPLATRGQFGARSLEVEIWSFNNYINIEGEGRAGRMNLEVELKDKMQGIWRVKK